MNNGELRRIVITDLFNCCNPLIRYDTGDIGSINFEVSPPVFTRIEGRRSDNIFNTNGHIVLSFIIIKLLKYTQKTREINSRKSKRIHIKIKRFKRR